MDVDGFLTGVRGMSLAYSGRGELLSATLPSGAGTVRYRYDGFGRRIMRISPLEEVTYYMYNDPGQIHLVTDIYMPTGKHMRFRHDPNGRLAVIHYDNVDYIVVTTHVGTPLAVVEESSGTVVLARTYDAYGHLQSETGTFDLPIGFAGGIADEATGLVNFFRRDYDPVVGRFCAKDPLVFGGGSPNLFAYVFNDPVNFKDPLGLFCIGLQAGFIFGSGFEFCADYDSDRGFEASVCVKKYVGFGGGVDIDLFGDAKASKMKAYGKVYGSLNAGPAQLGGELAGGYDFTPENMPGRNPCKGGWSGEAGVEAHVGGYGGKWNSDDGFDAMYTRDMNDFDRDKTVKDWGKVKAKAGVEAGVELCAGNGQN